MDKYGNAEEISTERLFSSVGPGSQGPASQASSGRQQGGTCLSFRHFNQELFLGAASRICFFFVLQKQHINSGSTHRDYFGPLVLFCPLFFNCAA